jgi:hypothetical protein
MVKNENKEAMIDRAMRFGNSSVKFAGAQMERRLARSLVSRRYRGPAAVPLSRIFKGMTRRNCDFVRDLVFVSESVILSAQAAKRGWFGVIGIMLYGFSALRKCEDGF